MAENPSREQTKLVSYIISPEVRKRMAEAAKTPGARVEVIISPVESKDEPEKGVGPAKTSLADHLRSIKAVNVRESDFYVFASLLPEEIDALADRPEVYQIWNDHQTEAHLLSTVNTIKAAACWRTFDARGDGITWAVLDSGIKSNHPHFDRFKNIDTTLQKNFSSSTTLEDRFGHGTHVAGIIAGCPAARSGDEKPYRAATYVEDAERPKVDPMPAAPSGVAPMAKLVNVKVLNDDGSGSASASILGLEYLRKINQNSRTIRIDGANLSLGYPFDPKWYGCGHSPLCQEVRRTVNSGICVVVSAGNSGYGAAKDENLRDVPIYLDLSINDPANTEEAIAVGSVHKSAPHKFGISYFSSKGPTGDGRMKPDLVAPGEKIISCSIHWDDAENGYDYEEKSGTSMAAPHVSGAIAAFLSLHSEYRGDPQRVKEVFLKTATDLRRDAAFQGAGLVDLLRAVTSV